MQRRRQWLQQVNNLQAVEDQVHDNSHVLLANIEILHKLSVIAKNNKNLLLDKYVKFYSNELSRQLMTAINLHSDPVKIIQEHMSRKMTSDQIQAQKIIDDFYQETNRSTPRRDFLVDQTLFDQIRSEQQKTQFKVSQKQIFQNILDQNLPVQPQPAIPAQQINVQLDQAEQLPVEQQPAKLAEPLIVQRMPIAEIDQLFEPLLQRPEEEQKQPRNVHAHIPQDLEFDAVQAIHNEIRELQDMNKQILQKMASGENTQQTIKALQKQIGLNKKKIEELQKQ